MSFTYAFYQHIMFRKSCHKCHYTNTVRPSDITIADFWGWEKTDSNFNKDNKGCSLIICNTEKGIDLFDEIKKDVHFIPTTIEKSMQPCLREPSSCHPKRDEFEAYYSNYGFEKAFRKFGLMGWRLIVKKVIRKIKYLLKIK